jgi:hypothetical protein
MYSVLKRIFVGRPLPSSEQARIQATVLIPEFVVHRWWEQLLHNQTALFLKGRLLFREGVVVTSLP